MDKRKKWIIHSTQLFTEAAVLSAVYALIILREYGGGAVHTGWWILMILLGYAANVFLRETASSVNLTTILDVGFVLGAGAAGQFLLRVEDPSLLMRIYVFGAVAGTALHVTVLAEDEPTRRTLMLYLDVLIVTLCMLLALQAREPEELLAKGTLWCLVALAATAGDVLLYRTESFRPETAGILAVLAGGCGLAALSGRFLQGAGAAGMSGLLWIAGLVITAVRRAGHWLMEGLFWLFRLFPAAESEMGEPAAPGIVVQVEEMLPDETVMDPRWIGMIVLAAAAVLLWRVLRRYRGLRWHPDTAGNAPEEGGERYQRETLWRRLWQKLRTRWSFEMCYLRRRNTAAGLFTFTERRFSGVLSAVRADESQPGWLRRLPEQMEAEHPEWYRSLAETLEKQYYAGQPAGVPPEFCRQYRRSVRRDAGRARAEKR